MANVNVIYRMAGDVSGLHEGVNKVAHFATRHTAVPPCSFEGVVGVGAWSPHDDTRNARTISQTPRVILPS